MAAAVTSVVTKLGELVIKEGVLLYEVRSKIEEVKMQLDQMQGFLKHAATKQIQDERIKTWVKNIREVASEIEVAIDTYHVEMAESRFKIFKSAVGFRLWARYKLGSKITKIQSKIHLINTARTTYGIENLRDDEREQWFPSRRVVVDNDDHYEIVGFKDVQEQLREDLLGGGTDQRWRVVSVVGQGGLGKTTIAENVYRTVKEHFEISIWLTVSNGSNLVFSMLRKGLEKLGKEVPDGKDKGYLVEEMRKTLGERKYLVVLDDVWTDNFFSEFGRALPRANTDSRVLMTSRFSNVAKKADPDSTPYPLPFLTEEESLKLLRSTGFRNAGPNSCSWDGLINIAKQIVKKCGYLPLAIKVVGGLLSEKDPIYNCWNDVLRTMDWQQDDTEYSECLKVLALSYENLPYSLRPCFLYLACFPEDQEIDAGSLLRMWIAEGFIRPTSSKIIMEDLANDYLEKLAQRCLIQVTRRSLAFGQIRIFRVHDLLRDLVVREAEEQNFVHINAQQNGGTNYTTRRATHFQTDVVQFCNSSNLNSMLILNAKIPYRVSFRLLRVLELYSVNAINELPVEITTMVNLRYLGLRYTTVSLPKYMDRLQYLQTLDITWSRMTSIPIRLWHIKTLRHFLARHPCRKIDGPPRGSNLRELQTLRDVRVMNWENGLPRLKSVRELGLLIDDQRQAEPVVRLLRKLNHLRYLSLRWDMDIAHPDMFDMSSFRSYQYIQSLKLNGRWPPQCSLIAAMLPTNLTKLVLKDSALTKDPMPELMKLSNLKFLRLYWGVQHCEKIVCPAGGFLHLERLIIRHGTFEEFVVNSGSFRVLKYLKLFGCKRLRMLPDLNHVPTLQELRLSYIQSALQSRCTQPDGEDWHKIKHIPSIIIE